MCIESRRRDCLIIGENLGTVPSYVNTSMARHHLLQMHILQYEIPGERSEVLREIPDNALAGLNTHDMPTFAAFWRGMDIDDREKVGLLDRQGAEREKRRRRRIKQLCVQFLRQRGWLNHASTLPAVLRACLSYLCESKVRIVLVNLEDLWFETLPQNVPGTGEDHPNWRRKIRHPLEMAWRRRFVRETLRKIDTIRSRS
jgi:4-alpha-glucanotransferase